MSKQNIYLGRKVNLFFKKVIDFLGSLIGIIILSPIFLIISILLKLTSPGPVFFKQNRLGKNGKEFKIIKFRTMIIDAEILGDKLKVKNESDFRITKLGKFLRTYSLDELPQLVNVIKGDMSLVGPRPPVPYFPYEGYDNYPKWAQNRFSMQPGITGLTQVTVRNSVSWDERIKIDNKYIEQFCLFFDFKILLMTLFRIFRIDNVYLSYKTDRR